MQTFLIFFSIPEDMLFDISLHVSCTNSMKCQSLLLLLLLLIKLLLFFFERGGGGGGGCVDVEGGVGVGYH